MQKNFSVIKLEPGHHGQPVWIASESSLFWVDHLDRKLYQYQPDSNDLSSFQLDAPILSIAPRSNNGFIASLEDGIGFFDMKQRKVTYISKPEPFSDNKALGGMTDASGCYWSYTHPPEGSDRQPNLYHIGADMKMQKFSDEHWLATAAPVFSTNGHTLYQSSGKTRYIYATHLDENKQPVETEAICRISKSEGYPHGLCVDSEDNIWVCHKAFNMISRYTHSGDLIEKIKVNAPGTEYCAFGGENLDQLFIITSGIAEDSSNRKNAQANALISFAPGTVGFATQKFAG